VIPLSASLATTRWDTNNSGGTTEVTWLVMSYRPGSFQHSREVVSVSKNTMDIKMNRI